jgi:hypothetical protein
VPLNTRPPLVRAFAEAVSQAEHSPVSQAEHSLEVREGLIDAYARGRELVRELLPGESADAPQARVVASLLLAIFDGLLIQWLLDPAQAPTGDELADLAAAFP